MLDIVISPVLTTDSTGLASLGTFISSQASTGYTQILFQTNYIHSREQLTFAIISQNTKRVAKLPLGTTVFVNSFEFAQDSTGLTKIATWMNAQVALGATLVNDFDVRDLGNGSQWITIIMSTGLPVTATHGVLSVGVTEVISFGTYSSLLVEASGGDGGIVLTLPTAMGTAGNRIVVKKIDASAGGVALATTDSQTIDSLPGYTLVNQWQYVGLESDGADWMIVSNS